LVAGGLPQTLAAFQEAADYARKYWAEAAMGLKFAGPFRMKAQYAEAIQASSAWDYPANGDPWHVIITPDQRIAAMAELMVPPYDMKPGILAGPNALRFDSKGNRYKMIPFRHSKEGLPGSIVDLMESKRETTSRLVGEMVQHENGVVKVRRKLFSVQWGGRLEKSDLKQLDIEKPVAKKIEGMVRVRQAYEKIAEDTLMTWRYLGHKSPPWAWWHPGFQPNPILQQVLPHVAENFKNAVQQGLMADIRAILKGEA
jgi:hypothetical protein